MSNIPILLKLCVVASSLITPLKPCSFKLSSLVSSNSFAMTVPDGTANTNIPLPAVGSNTLLMPRLYANMSATKAIGKGVLYCCILIRLLLRLDIVGCISYNWQIASKASFDLMPPYCPDSTTSLAALTSPSSTSSWSMISSLPSLSTSMPSCLARFLMSVMLL